MFYPKIANIQFKPAVNKRQNLQKAADLTAQLADQDIDFITLPEMFNCPYQTDLFMDYAELEGGESWRFCAALAKEHRAYLIAGSMPEKDEQSNVYNTCYIFNRQGEQVAKHRKIHLFDIDIVGKQCFKESDTLTAGKEVTVFASEFGNIGVCICYDIRFPELFRLMVKAQSKIVFVPATFNTTTGPMHWELLFRARAVDNQIFMVGTSTAYDETVSYHAYGHSIIVNPWGEVVADLGINEKASIVTLDLSVVEQVRRELPLLAHRRLDLYDVNSKK